MKRTVLIVAGIMSLLFLFVNCNNETEEEVKGGIAFQALTFDAAIAKGKASHKIVFIDAYATWCGPCKQLSKKTFVDKKVAELFNAKFVNVKMDADQAEGKKFAEKYLVDCKSKYQYTKKIYELFKTIHKGKAKQRYIECWNLLKLKTE